MIEILYSIMSLLLFFLYKRIGPVALFASFICAMNVLFSLIANHSFDFSQAYLEIFCIIPIFYLYYLISKKGKISNTLYILVSKKITYDYKLGAMVIAYAILTVLVTNKVKFSTGGAFDFFDMLIGMIGAVLLTASLILLAFTKSSTKKTLTLMILFITPIFGESRGAAIFPILTYITLSGEIQRISNKTYVYKWSDLRNYLIPFLSLALIFAAISSVRYASLDSGGVLINMVKRGDAIFQYRISKEMGLSMDRSIPDSVSSSIFFLVPRVVYPSKVNLSTYDLTSTRIGGNDELTVSVNMGIAWMLLITNTIPFVIFNIMCQLVFITFLYFFYLKRRSTSLVSFALYVSTIPTLLLTFENGLFDSPAQRSIIQTLIITYPIALWLSYKLKPK